MKNLIERNKTGEWNLRGVPWKCLREGSIITKEVQEKLYGALCKLLDYEKTGLNPEEVEQVNDFDKCQSGILLKKLSKEQQKHKWVPVKEKLPDTEDYILISFENFSVPAIGRYEKDKDGSGAFYIGDETETCISQNLYVNAWQQLPTPYRLKEEDDV